LEALDVPPSAAVHVGDRPEKDVAGPAAAGMAGAVRVRQGEYADVVDGPGAHVPLAVVHEIRAALRMIRGAVEGASEPFSGSSARAEATTPQGAERTALVAGAGVSHAAAGLRSNERHAFPQEAGRRVARVDQNGKADSGPGR
jgi:hypothetical protein